MGLDQYARVVDNDGTETEIAYWRKHPNLQGWMEDLYIKKGGTQEFNCESVSLEEEDIDALERAVNYDKLPTTEGFFFGDEADQHYKKQDLQFIQDARKALENGLRVEYSSWWQEYGTQGKPVASVTLIR